jgi:hypothetical protein
MWKNHLNGFPEIRVAMHDSTVPCQRRFLNACWLFVSQDQYTAFPFVGVFASDSERTRLMPFPVDKLQTMTSRLQRRWKITLCTIVFPWGQYRYKRLPMGINCAPDIFQEKMSNLMTGLRTYVLRRPTGYYLGIVSRLPTACTNCTAKIIRSGPSDKCRQVDILCYRNWVPVSWFLDNSSGCSTNDQ